MTNPARSATEQLLLSTAADRAIRTISFADFRDKRVFVDAAFFESYDSKYVVGAVREAVSHAGGLLQSEAAKSEIIIEVRSGALAIDSSQSFIGIPQLGGAVPVAGALQTPELALYKASRQDALAKIAILAYETDSRSYVAATTSTVGKSYNRYYKFLGIITWTNTDLPEKRR